MTRRKEDVLRVLEQQAQAKRENRLRAFVPYDKQREFMNLGTTKRERLLMAANQSGKSESGSVEMAYHLTGDYPSWWEGRRFDHPVRAWTGGESAQSVRQIQQTKLLGTAGVPDALGTGFLPKSKIIRTTASHGIGDSVDTVQVRHVTGGVSTLQFKSYEQSKEKWSGATLDVVWLDEEPPIGIYSEALTRITATGGMVYVTFTPLLGISDVVGRYLNEPSPDRAVVTMTIEDALHIDPAERARIVAGYLPHEREARARGIPMLGSGRVFLEPEESISVAPFEIPPHFALLWAIDFGVHHPFAAVLLAWDRDADVVYIVHCIRMSDALPLQHAAAMKPVLNGWGARIPVAWPQDGTQRREFEGALTPTKAIYKAHGLRMLDSHAKFADGSNSTEAGILAMQERFATSRLKVFSNLSPWFEEYRQYHRKEGQLVKLRDDILSASRVGIMQLRSAKPVLFDPNRPNERAGQGSRFARGANPDAWGA